MQGMRFHHFGGGGGRRGEREAVIRIISQLEEEAGGIFFRAPGQKPLLPQERKRKEKWNYKSLILAGKHTISRKSNGKKSALKDHG